LSIDEKGALFKISRIVNIQNGWGNFYGDILFDAWQMTKLKCTKLLPKNTPFSGFLTFNSSGLYQEWILVAIICVMANQG